MKKRSKQALSFLLALYMVTSLVLPSFAADTTSDYAGHWAESTIQSWLDDGLLQGDATGNVNPDAPITRAEFITLVNRMMQYTQAGTEIASYTDVSASDWYYQAAAIALHEGYLSGTSAATLSPTASITREQAFVMLARLQGLTADTDTAALSAVTDAADISSWAADGTAAMLQNGFVTGANGNITPLAGITRAESLVLLDRVHTNTRIYGFAGAYGSSDNTQEAANVTITAPGVTLQNLQITGDLTIAASVGEGDVHLDNVSVAGQILVNGGGEHSLYFANITCEGGIVVSKAGNGNVRIVASGNTNISAVALNTGAILVTQELTGGGIKQVTIPAEYIGTGDIELIGSFSNVTNDFSGAKIAMDGATVGSLALNAAADISGTGTIQNAAISQEAGGNSTLSVKPSAMSGAGAGSVNYSGSAASGSTSGSSSSSSSSSSGSGGNSSNTDSTAPTLSTMSAMVSTASVNFSNNALTIRTGSAMTQVKMVMSERITIGSSASVLMNNGSSNISYGTLSLDSTDTTGKTVLITPDAANISFTANGSYTFSVAANSILDTSANGNAAISFTVVATDDMTTLLTFDTIKGQNTSEQSVTANLTLPATLPTDSTVQIAWASSDTGVIATNGTVTRPTTNDASVTLTATLTSGSTSQNKTFDLVVRNTGIDSVSSVVNDGEYYATGYPMATIEGGKVVAKVQLKQAAQVYMIAYQTNANNWDASVAGVLGGYADIRSSTGSQTDNYVYIDYVGYQNITDTTQTYTFDTDISPQSNHKVKLAFVIKNGSYTSSAVSQITFDLASASATDSTAPDYYGSAYVNAAMDKIYLYNDEPLDLTSVPATGDFSIIGSDGNPVSGVSVDAVALSNNPSDSHFAASCVALTVSGLSSSSDVSVKYTPGTAKIQDQNDNACSTFTLPIAPATLSIDQVHVNASQGTLHAHITPCISINSMQLSASDFTVKNGSDVIAITDLDYSYNYKDLDVYLTFAPNTAYDDISVTYTPQSGMSDWAQDTIPTTPIAYTGSVTYLPQITSATVTAVRNQGPDYIRLRFENTMQLETYSVAAGYFTLTVDGTAYQLRGFDTDVASTNAYTVDLNLDTQTHLPNLNSASTITISYTIPSSSPSNALRDLSGAYVASFSGVTVTTSPA